MVDHAKINMNALMNVAALNTQYKKRIEELKDRIEKLEVENATLRITVVRQSDTINDLSKAVVRGK